MRTSAGGAWGLLVFPRTPAAGSDMHARTSRKPHDTGPIHTGEFPMAVDIQRAQQLLAKGLTPTQVAQRLGINSATARKIAAGKYREGSNAKN